MTRPLEHDPAFRLGEAHALIDFAIESLDLLLGAMNDTAPLFPTQFTYERDHAVRTLCALRKFRERERAHDEAQRAACAAALARADGAQA